MGVAVVTGGNRGIGLGFVTELLNRKYTVIATYRNATTLDALNALKEKYPTTLSLYQLDVTDLSGIKRFAETVKKVNLLILNAGIKGYPPGTTLLNLNPEDHRRAVEVNGLATQNMMQAFYPCLIEEPHACAVYISSGVSSTVRNKSGGYPGYRDTKEMGNSIIWNWSIELMKNWKSQHPDRLFETPCAFAICPGHVKTKMGGESAPLSVEESVLEMMMVIEDIRRTKKSNGLYMHGTVEPYVQYETPDVLKEVLDAVEHETKEAQTA